MNVESYIFQSPSPNPVQVGRLDTTTQKEDASSQKKTQETAKAVEPTQELQVKETEALQMTSANNTIDLYV